ncbi:MAG TPA: hypothetical protein VH475_28070, partial [Tepidisphaeraceae bacterium]
MNDDVSENREYFNIKCGSGTGAAIAHECVENESDLPVVSIATTDSEMNEDPTAPEGDVGSWTISRDNSSASIDVIFSVTGGDAGDWALQLGEYLSQLPDGTYDLQMAPGVSQVEVQAQAIDNARVNPIRDILAELQNSPLQPGDFGTPYTLDPMNVAATVHLKDDDANTELLASNGIYGSLDQSITAGTLGVFPQTYKVKTTDYNGDPVAGKLVDLVLNTPNLQADHASATTDAGGYATFHVSGRNADTYTVSTHTHNPGPETFGQILVANPVFHGNSAH